MTHNLSVLEKDALGLPTSDRARLAEILLASLDKPDPNVDALWADEADVRVKAFDAGELKARPASEVFGKYKSQ